MGFFDQALMLDEKANLWVEPIDSIKSGQGHLIGTPLRQVKPIFDVQTQTELDDVDVT